MQDAGELLRALAAAFEGLDAAQIRRHTQLAVMGAMVEQLVSCPRKLSGTVLNAMFKLLGEPQAGAGRVPRREGPIDWPPELPEIVRKLYGVNVFDTPRTLRAGEPDKAAASHPEESPADG
ncbi:MAG TPA: hypothetical protein VGM03_21500 [Phycisphaerae bacterium]